MPFKKGERANPSGRPKGSPNKTSQQVKATIEQLLTDPSNVQKLQAEFAKLEGRDYLKAWTDLLPYIAPKLQSTSMDIDLNQLSDEQVDELYEKVMNAIKQP